MAAEAVVTFAAEEILKKVLSLAHKELRLAWGFKAELRNLQGSFGNIQLLLNNVADKPQDPLIEEWVKKLKGVADDAEDVLDEFQYEVDRRKVEIQNHMKKKVLNFFSLSNPLAFRLKMAHKIQKINASLVVLERKAAPLGLVSKNNDATPQGIRWDRRTVSLIGNDEITVGREDDVSNIVKTLTDYKYDKENLAVMAIVGMGGLGKTTLAKSVCNQDSIRTFFEERIWVCLSDNFDVNLILLHMLEHLNPAKTHSKDNKNVLLKFLNEELKDKRYLLVLDDVWNEDVKKWNYLIECLSKLNSAGGSKIMVTTRSYMVASVSEMILPLPRYEMGRLSEKECWSIMKYITFPIGPELEAIGKEIAKKCRGVPLTAKVAGGILSTKKSVEEWSLFKNNRLWNNLSEQDTIMPVLRLSFDKLESPSLKQCFAYCSMFEKDFEIQRDNLIQLWMAQGLLHPSPRESRDMEDIGNEYFKILLQSSLFQDVTRDYNGTISKVKMHDLVHDLAEYVSNSESLTSDLYGIGNTSEIRHVARVSISTLEEIPERSAGKLRSLFSDDGEVPTNILLRFKALRVLTLSKAKIEELPVSIDTLKHLRYLDISKTRFKQLPTSIGKLYNLQTLRATNCSLEEFPKELQNLINMRYIYFDESTKFPQGIRQWTCLRTLPYFSVGNEIGRGIEELAGLEQLKGKLVVCNLEHIKNGEEAKKAKLENKTKVCNVAFIWTKDRLTIDKNREEDVLEGLQLHRELESLSIENFMGVKFPSWMCGSLLLNNLKKIQLLDCEKCEGVPPLGHLPNLTELKISGMPNLKCLGAEFYAYDVVHSVCPPSEETLLFPALKVLYISGCSELIEWKEEPMMSTKTVKVFPCLEKLDIRNCSKMRNAPSHFPALQKLVIISSESITPIEFLQKRVIPSGDTRMPIQQISRELTTLASLEIEGIKELTCLPQEILKENEKLSSLEIRECDDLTCIGQDVYGSCGFLKRLVVWNCENVCHLPEGLDTLPLLEYMDISRCPSLVLIPITEGMTSLRTLEIKDCEELESLGSSLLFPLSLKRLAINSLPNLEILPGLDSLNSLRDLQIKNLRKLKSLPTGLQCLTGLTELRIGGFWEELATFPDFQVGSSEHLTRLELTGWPKLKFLPEQIQHFTSLTFLEINRFDGVETLPEWLGSLTSLKYLRFSQCKTLIKLPSVQAMQRLTDLQTLDIEGCSDHLKQNCTRDSGTEWHKISHIPRIRK